MGTDNSNEIPYQAIYYSIMIMICLAVLSDVLCAGSGMLRWDDWLASIDLYQGDKRLWLILSATHCFHDEKFH